MIIEKKLEVLLEAAKQAKERLLNSGGEGHVITLEEHQENKQVFRALAIAIAQASEPIGGEEQEKPFN